MAKNGMDSNIPLQSIRNIGVIAHIDAGKTTLTERFLYYSGKTHKIGDIDAGNTVMDYLDEERSRGITIVAAAASFHWSLANQDHLFHLIDTPGHIDFTAEVERSIRVSDGAVVIFSGVEGVEAQSEKVWRQSDQYGVPKIAFINKMDRVGASFERTFVEINETFSNIKAVAVQLPMGAESEFNGVIDLIDMKALSFQDDDGSNVVSGDIPPEFIDQASAAREELLSAVADYSEAITDLYLEEKDIPSELLHEELRRLVLAGRICPVFAGSAKRNIGVQPLMNAVIRYLPNPKDRGACPAINPKTEEPVSVDVDDPDFAGLVFKIIAGDSADLIYLRTYSGQLKQNDSLLNVRTGDKVRIKRLLRLYAKNLEPVEEVGPGDIVGVIGPQGVTTGDTLCAVNHPVALEKITFPEPVISMAIEPKSNKDKDKLRSSLELLCREDPTLRLKIHENTGQQILSGMGELHLEINCHRLEEEFNLQARYGAPQVAFRETIKEPCSATGVFDKTIGEQTFHAEVDFTLEPVPRLESGIDVALNVKDKSSVPKQWLKSAEEALENGLRTGGNWGYPLIYIRGAVTAVRGTSDKTTENAVAGAVLEGLCEAIGKGTKLLEPIMSLEIIAPDAVIGEITGYLQTRRAVIHGMDDLGDTRRLKCEVPLAEMFGFSKALPKLSGGRAAFSMEPCGYQEISSEDLERMVHQTS